MAEVWIVIPGGYDEYGLDGVYDSLEAAMAANPDEWVEDEGGYSNGGSALSMGSLKHIEAWAVETTGETDA